VSANGYTFDSATNDAITDSLFSLNDYSVADYILGNESTTYETFSNAEQVKVRDFLDNGGSLFVSGSEIAWDLDYRGQTSDKNFIWDFLKMKYVADAPENKSGVYYQAQPVPGSFAEAVPQFYFDDGTHGTINVSWPDLVSGTDGGKGFMEFTGVDTASGFSGINFSGMFPNGIKPGKVVGLTFPFETVYPEDVRNNLMGKILNYFDLPTAINKNESAGLPTEFSLYQNYPNPFNPSTVIKYTVPHSSNRENYLVRLEVYDVLGKRVRELVNDEKHPGTYEVSFNASGLASGLYIYVMHAGNFNSSKKMIFLK
jgi:hypothetical protein